MERVVLKHNGSGARPLRPTVSVVQKLVWVFVAVEGLCDASKDFV